MPYRRPEFRFSELSYAEAERIVETVWRFVEEHQIASPQLLVKPNPNGSLQLAFVFRADDRRLHDLEQRLPHAGCG
jgi:hypothetical protein